MICIPRGRYLGRRLGDPRADEADHFIRWRLVPPLLVRQHCAAFHSPHDSSENNPTVSGSEKPPTMARLKIGLRKFFVGLGLALGAREHAASSSCHPIKNDRSSAVLSVQF
jgi:hypothetical protein